ncbi:MAG: two-component system sensor histidine kinase TctE [Porticoccaceae bacterium]|jgi:two-component system sensor histidine kinase TctE
MKSFRTDLDRFGIRARLLTLLLPGILILLVLDSWNDHHALRNLVRDTYDEAMLDSLNGLRSSLSLTEEGTLRLNPSVRAPTMSDSTNLKQKYVHVSLTPCENTQAIAGKPPRELTLLGNTDLPAAPVPIASEEFVSPVWYDSYYRDKPIRVVAFTSQVTDGRGQHFDFLIQVAESTEPWGPAQAVLLQQELIRDALLLLVVIVLVWLGVTWSLRPLEKLRKFVLQGKAKELKPLDTRSVPYEVAPLVDAINQQIINHQALLDRQSQFLADASHQLRTPLAIMLTQAGVALREKNSESVWNTLRAIVTQISRSRRLCEQLLSLAYANDSNPPSDVPSLVDLNAIAKDVVLQYLTLAHERNHDLGWIDAREASTPQDFMNDALPATWPSMEPVVPVLAIGPELHEALANLIHNAIVYTPSGGHITVRVRTRGRMALVEVTDDGPGIAVTQRKEVFQRFHQTSASPGKTAHGAGLGLAIARAYALRNDGDIELADPDVASAGLSSNRPGLSAILRIPLAPNSQS